ncbi:hypothetical protein GS508_24465 [Rhodococcus hoagii]|nr:hypothetical protein [Prescottella equi]
MSDVFARISEQPSTCRRGRGRRRTGARRGRGIHRRRPDHDGGRSVSALEYQAPRRRTLPAPMLRGGRRTHRSAGRGRAPRGSLVIGDLALVAAVAAPHRAEAFAACAELVERIKAEVPIWKRQTFATERPSGWACSPPGDRPDTPSIAATRYGGGYWTSACRASSVVERFLRAGSRICSRAPAQAFLAAIDLASRQCRHLCRPCTGSPGRRRA